MGELHLENIKDRLWREYHLPANTGAPTISYRETISRPGAAAQEFDRTIGGQRQFAKLRLELSPQPRQSGNVIEFNLSPNSLPLQFRPAVEAGIRDGLVTGVLGQFAIIDIKVELLDALAHPVDSTEMAFRSAAVMAFRAAVRQAAPVLLEPIMALEILTPNEYMGDILGDLNARRGKVKDLVSQPPLQIIRADVPLAELFGYATAIRSLTRGRASYTMEPRLFEVVPKEIQQRVLNR